MENLEKGCVYFFKHKGLTPIKIGYSLSESPNERLLQFKTYAPFGVELIGFIITNHPAKLEKELHKRFESKRLSGEWFEITVEEAVSIIKFYTSDEELEKRTNFEIAYSKFIWKNLNENTSKEEDLYPLYCFDIGKKNKEGSQFLSVSEIKNKLEGKIKQEISIQNLSILLKKLGFRADRKIINDKFLRGYWVIEK